MQIPSFFSGSRKPSSNWLRNGVLLAFGLSLLFNLILWQRWQISEEGTTYQRNQVTALRTQLNSKAVAAADSGVQINAAALPLVSEADYQRGASNPKVTLIEYSDMECPFCKRFHPTLQQIEAAYPNDVKVVYRHYPLSFHKNAQKQAEASECVGAIGGQAAFWKFTDAIYDRTKAGGTGFALESLAPLADEVGVSGSAVQACINAGTYARKVSEQMTAGASAGVSGTPGTFAINTKGTVQFINGAQSFEAVKKVVDQLISE